MGFPSWSLTFPDRVKDCALTVITTVSSTNIAMYFFAFIVNNNAVLSILLYQAYSRHSHDARALTHRMLMRNQRKVLTSLPPKLRMKSR